MKKKKYRQNSRTNVKSKAIQKKTHEQHTHTHSQKEKKENKKYMYVKKGREQPNQ